MTPLHMHLRHGVSQKAAERVLKDLKARAQAASAQRAGRDGEFEGQLSEVVLEPEVIQPRSGSTARATYEVVTEYTVRQVTTLAVPTETAERIAKARGFAAYSARPIDAHFESDIPAAESVSRAANGLEKAPALHSVHPDFEPSSDFVPGQKQVNYYAKRGVSTYQSVAAGGDTGPRLRSVA